MAQNLSSDFKKIDPRSDDIKPYQLSTSSIFEGLKIPKSIPLYFIKFIKTADFKHIINEIRHSNRELGVSVNHVIIILIGRHPLVQDLQKFLKLKLTATYGIDIIFLRYREVQMIVASKNPRDTFRSIVISQVDKKNISPFTIAGPVPDNIFFGREREISTVLQHAKTNSYAFIGGRRIGKTSVLRSLHKLRLKQSGFITIYHDCSYIKTIRDFLFEEIKDIQSEDRQNPEITFKDLFSKIKKGDKPIVVLLDEVDGLIEDDRYTDWRFFNYLRAITTTHNVQIVLGGERSLRTAIRDPEGPLFNFTNEMLLGPLDKHAVNELITRPFKQMEIELITEEKVVDKIFKFTSGHPNVVQRLCFRLVNAIDAKGVNRITLKDVNHIINNPKFQEEDYLDTFWDRATPLERIISLLMAQNPKSYHLDQILKLLSKHKINADPATVVDSLDRLVQLRSILYQSQEGYDFAVKSFPKIIKKNRYIDSLFTVLESEYRKERMEISS